MLRLALISFVAASCAMAAHAQPSPLQLEAKIPLDNVAGRIDHMAFDAVRSRLFVAELGNNSLSVVDVNVRKVIHRVLGLKEPQGVGYFKPFDTVYVANGGDGSVRIYRGEDLAQIGTVALGEDADNVRIDQGASRVVVGYGKGALAVIEPGSHVKTSDIPLKAHPESFQLDQESEHIFINLPDTRSIAVVNKATGQEIANWRQTYAGNYAMALDNEKERVFVVFRDPAKFVALAEDTGATVAEADTCGDVDDLFLDARRKRVYISCGQGFIDVLDARDPGFARLGRIATVPGARTSLFVPNADRLFLAVRAQGGHGAAIWVYRAVD